MIMAKIPSVYYNCQSFSNHKIFLWEGANIYWFEIKLNRIKALRTCKQSKISVNKHISVFCIHLTIKLHNISNIMCEHVYIYISVYVYEFVSVCMYAVYHIAKCTMIICFMYSTRAKSLL